MMRKGDVAYDTRPGDSGTHMAVGTPSDPVVVEQAPASPTIVTEQKWPPMAVSCLRGAVEGAVIALGVVGTLIQADPDIAGKLLIAASMTVISARMAFALGIGAIDQFNARKQ